MELNYMKEGEDTQPYDEGMTSRAERLAALRATWVPEFDTDACARMTGFKRDVGDRSSCR